MLMTQPDEYLHFEGAGTKHRESMDLAHCDQRSVGRSPFQPVDL